MRIIVVIRASERSLGQSEGVPLNREEKCYFKLET
jgi:hypothetical protein